MNIVMPSLSAGMESAVIARWLKSVGDEVKRGEPIAEVETDKAIVELTAEVSGHLKEILVEPGNSAKVHQRIAVLHSQDATVATNISSFVPAAFAPSLIAPSCARSSRIIASPLARRIAVQNGIDLFGLTGSGPRGRIVKLDVQAACAALGSTSSRTAPEPLSNRTANHAAIPSAEAARSRGVAEPQFRYETEIEVDALMSLLDEINATRPANGQISFSDLFVRASAVVMAHSGAARTSDIAVVDRTAQGFRRIIIADAADKTVSALSSEIQRARENVDVGATGVGDDQIDVFTVFVYDAGSVSLSIFGIGRALMLSVGGRKRCAVARGDDLVLASVVRCDLSLDQTTNDRLNGSEWLGMFRETIENPYRLFV
ncbi:E3 binding domain-containing protein [Bradyrhizobium yuanmingense]|uniref:biotin/lipoyl-containing protein n=1 Tax=Bradyrhizobium yuanmingense TaxID=108015 RepID=UPI0021A800C3|nr:biotin/lipoyl-containing protein [Bradyrhizobium sp. CB1024]UWU83089.1 E3 binding domain-containing protein [Bradyrhizobium sp. CB1024]